MWRISALGDESNSAYVYLVDAPEDAVEMDVVCSAYAQHGTLKAADMVPEWLGPIWTTTWEGADSRERS